MKRERANVEALRRRTWPKRKKPETHPQRWTGRTLADDARRATEAGGYEFDALSALRYAESCSVLTRSHVPSMQAIGGALGVDEKTVRKVTRGVASAP